MGRKGSKKGDKTSPLANRPPGQDDAELAVPLNCCGRCKRNVHEGQCPAVVHQGDQVVELSNACKRCYAAWIRFWKVEYPAWTLFCIVCL